MKPLLTAHEAAAYLRLTPKALYNQRSRGEKPGSLGLRIGRAVRWDPDELEEWAHRQRSERVS